MQKLILVDFQEALNQSDLKQQIQDLQMELVIKMLIILKDPIVTTEMVMHQKLHLAKDQKVHSYLDQVAAAKRNFQLHKNSTIILQIDIKKKCK